MIWWRARGACWTRPGRALRWSRCPARWRCRSAIALAHRMSNFDGYVALGCVIRGETTHYDTVCNDSSRGLTLLGLQGAAIGNGILTVENRDQAVVRADAAGQNKGGGAAAAALHLIALARKWGGETKGAGVQARGRQLSDRGHRRVENRMNRDQKRQMKSAARLYAVQALFQMEASGPDRRGDPHRVRGSPVWRDL